ncbi:hypothetical protein [Streptococcus suis]|uniref:hypothetical protein n=1 Tax=Streptococcus suis TaxID=1307 RepID=UPI001FC966D0|nr:hypothetical protein [Streptococcus suis]
MERTKKNTKRKIVDTVMGVVLACGIGILSYPFIRNSLNDLMNQKSFNITSSKQIKKVPRNIN